ncbi:hypothetical protein C8R32_1186 [Nitrosospira sp. Nsp5]|uniref:Uncharacterized protein n=1 Tax=Nitrosospira multiformis TaxID=1231 RepID=A0ABY0TMS4_9PROT|nr:hypothetical protein C8R32_1186 [Nitrosospira sp. Nsp5]SDR10825.1 hypothetical protein SAMN05216402_3262 [Nitrosospira multiformis]
MGRIYGAHDYMKQQFKIRVCAMREDFRFLWCVELGQANLSFIIDKIRYR